jgi:hypothetical protein
MSFNQRHGGPMNRIRLLAYAVATCSGLIFSGAAWAESADESAIRTVNINWGKAYNGGNAAILDFYTKDIADTKAQGAELVLACEPGDRSPAPCKSQTEVAVSGDMGWEVGYMKVIVKGAWLKLVSGSR